MLNTYISKIKGNDYRIDDRVPTSYLIGLVLSRIFMKLRGIISGIQNEGSIFIGTGVVVKSKRQFQVGKGVSIGKNCYIDALSENGITFGDNVSVGRNTIIECTGNIQFLGIGLTVGNNVGLGSGNFFGCAGGIKIGTDTIIGNFVSFHSENHVYSNSAVPIRLQGVTHQGICIGNDCWIGAKSTILDGVKVADGVIIAAGAVLKAGNYEKKGIYGGVPAKLIKFRD